MSTIRPDITCKPVVICLLLLFVSPNVRCLEIQGTYHTWLITIPLPTDLVQQMLPEKVSLHSPEGFDFPPNTHPVVMELGRELHCGPSIFKFLQTNFMEGKFDIPFVNIRDKSDIYNLKQVVYVDSIVQSTGAALTYKLNSRKAAMEMTDTFYKIEHSGAKLQANVTSDGEWGKVGDYPNFNIYKSILSQTWFGKDINTCGVHTYQFDEAKLRPVNISLQVTAGVFNEHFPLTKFQINSINQPFGAVESFLNFTIASPQKC